MSNEFFAMDTAMVKTLDTLLAKSDIETLAKLRYGGVALGALDAAAWRHLADGGFAVAGRCGLEIVRRLQ